MNKQRGSGDWVLLLIIFISALTFCGTPDLHDAMMSRLTVECPNPAANWQERQVPR